MRAQWLSQHSWLIPPAPHLLDHCRIGVEYGNQPLASHGRHQRREHSPCTPGAGRGYWHAQCKAGYPGTVLSGRVRR